MQNDKYPFPISGEFKADCFGCEIIEPCIDINRSMNGIVSVTLRCEYSYICQAIMDRPKKRMPLHPGQQVWFPNGQTGEVREIALQGTQLEPLIRICKSLDGDIKYDAEYSISSLGTDVFMSLKEAMAHEVQTKEESENEKG